MITNLNHITLAVTNIHRSFDFYKNILGFKPLVKWHQGAYFLITDPKNKTNDFWFCLNLDNNRQPTKCYTHYAFSVASADFANMSAKIKASGTTVFKENTSPGESLYFLDPDGHKLEIHVSNADERIAVKKRDSGHWQEVEWFI